MGGAILLCFLHTLLPVLADVCPSMSWYQYQTDCFLFVSDTVNWTTARDLCSVQHAHLVRNDNAAMDAFLREVMKAEDIRYVWTGANDMETEGTYVWENNGDNVTYTDWEKNNPNNYREQDCVRFAASKSWNDLGCDSLYSYACQAHKDINQDLVTTSTTTGESSSPGSDDTWETTTLDGVELTSSANVIEHTSSADGIEHTTSSDGKSHTTTADGVKHISPSDNETHTTTTDDVEHTSPSDNETHTTTTDDVEHTSPSDNETHTTTTDDVEHISSPDDVNNTIYSDTRGQTTSSVEVVNTTKPNHAKKTNDSDELDQITYSENLEQTTSSDDEEHTTYSASEEQTDSTNSGMHTTTSGEVENTSTSNEIANTSGSVSTLSAIDNCSESDDKERNVTCSQGNNTAVDDKHSTEAPSSRVCTCCITYNGTPLTSEQKQQIIAQLREELFVPKENLSAYRRKLISVNDFRSSSVTMGSLGCAMLSLVLLSIVLLDLIDLCRFLCGLASRKTA